MDAALEVITLPVSDPDVSLQFYRDRVGFVLDVDYAPTADFRVVQLTPQGSSASIQFGVGLTDAPPGSVHGLYLVVTDLDRARRGLAERGVTVGEIRHKDTGCGTWRGEWRAGMDPDHTDYASVVEIHDPDGNSWIVQERGWYRVGDR